MLVHMFIYERVPHKHVQCSIKLRTYCTDQNVTGIVIQLHKETPDTSLACNLHNRLFAVLPTME